MKDKFIKFLKDNKAYERFVKNLNGTDVSKHIDSVIDEPYSFISGSFIWGNDKYEYTYWADLNFKWLGQIDSKKI